MTSQEFDNYQIELFKKIEEMKLTKGKEYANSQDRFANFNRLAESLGLTNIQVGWVYTAKHLDAIAQYCRTGQTHSTESIESRFVDAITYLTLMAGMVAEKSKDTILSDPVTVPPHQFVLSNNIGSIPQEAICGKCGLQARHDVHVWKSSPAE